MGKDSGDEVINEINRRAEAFAKDNLVMPTEADIVLIRSAMMVGAVIQLEVSMKDELEEQGIGVDTTQAGNA